MKYLLIPIVLLSASQAHAFGGVKTCGVELQTGISATTDIHGQVKPTAKIGLNFDIGSYQECKVYNQQKVKQENAATLIKESDAQIRQNASIRDSIETLFKKIEICGKFSEETAPQSIKEFCGDLVGVSLSK